MTFLASTLSRKRLILGCVTLLSLLGLVFWMTMPRAEDPLLADYWGILVAPFPGATAESVERLVIEPIEEHLAEVEEIKSVYGTIRADVAVMIVELNGNVPDVSDAWEEVEKSLAEAEREFPAGVGKPHLDYDLQGGESVVVALTGSDDPLVLADAAKRLKKQLLNITDVSRIKIVGDPGEQITIAFDDATASRLGVGPASVAAQLAARNPMIPGGSLMVAGRRANVEPNTEFHSIEEIESTEITLPSGASIPLTELARVTREPVEPPTSRARLDGRPMVALGVIPKPGGNVIDFGRRVIARVDELRDAYEPLEIETVFFQPGYVENRLSGLNQSLAMGVLIVAAVLFASMGFRLGFVVSLIVPLVTFSSVAIFALGGGILHQMSIAALVLALGMLVDNAIVMSEAVQRRIDEGMPPDAAAIESVKELAMPLGSATGTTLAAFVPMLLSTGPTAQFTRSIPVVIMLTLTISYVFAVLVTPIMAAAILRPSKTGSSVRSDRVAGAMSRWSLSHGALVLAGVGSLLAASFAMLPAVRTQFFPEADRNQFVVNVSLPEGADLGATDAAARVMEDEMRRYPDVTAVAGFVGRGAPRFYYNITQKPNVPHFAQIVVTTRNLAAVPGVMAHAREFGRRSMPEAEVVVGKLEQGPPVGAPVEVRIFGWDLAELEGVTERVFAELKNTPGAVDVTQNLGLGSPTLTVAVDDAAAARARSTRADAAQAVLGRTRGISAGQYRGGEDPAPIVVRSTLGERFPVSDFADIRVAGRDGSLRPLSQMAKVGIEWRPSAIYHRDRRRVVTVSAQLAEGNTFSDVLESLEPRLSALPRPAGVDILYGGAVEGSSDANSALLRTVPFGVLLLLFFLLVEFNSFRRVALILLTVPLAAAGVIPGLAISGEPFGFMSLLGVIALVGIVVNNAIILIDVVDSRRREGASVEEAVSEAVRLRLRPILLTTGTTVVGMLPMALSSASLWPPLAWAMISGLIASTVLTLLAVPVCYRLLFGSRADAGLKKSSVFGREMRYDAPR